MRKTLLGLLALGLIAAITPPMRSQATQVGAPAAAGTAAVSAAQKKPASKSKAATKGTAKSGAAKPKAPVLVPLSERERAEQMLSRLTFGARPGDVDRVLAMGAENWFEQQLNPNTIADGDTQKRLGDYPTLNMQPQQALAEFPDRGTIQQVADGKKPMPTDPLLAAVYEVQGAKLRKEQESRKVDAQGNLPPEPSDADKAAEKQAEQATASRVAGVLLALQKNQRMAALIAMPVEDRIAFTADVGGEQKNTLMAEFAPREREAFYGMAAGVGAQYQIGQELAQAKMARAILSERQLQEVMTDFWFNHFNVYIAKDSDQWYTTSYERDAIRANALGKFGDLLLATAQHPAMLVYLDNWLSIGPDSLTNGVNPANPKSKPGNKGLNENYGREVMELHTVGVNGGYTQADVTNLSAILTGWTVNQPGQAGGFQFDAKRHEPGTKVWMGQRIGNGLVFMVQGGSAAAAVQAAKTAPAMDDQEAMGGMMMGAGGSGAEQKALGVANAPGNAGMMEGLEALNVLAHSPSTAHFICWKIAQRLVADNPPEALVGRMAATFLANDGDIKAVLRTMVASPEFNSRKYFRNKVKTPMEFLTSAYRATLTDPTNPGALVNTMRTMGMPLYNALPPTGYYITADKWMNTGALVDRLNFAVQLTGGNYGGQKFDAAKVVALGLMSEPAEEVQGATGDSTSGMEIALRVLQQTLVGGDVSAKTNALIHEQMDDAKQKATKPGDLLNLLTALMMGSPEFQVR